jgi:two-component system chemotaxis response regulator CheY
MARRDVEFENNVVMIIDDDPELRVSLAEYLEEAGYAVVAFSNGSDALAYLRKHPPPASILLDLFMPVMSGWEFARHLRSHRRLASIPVVVITGSEPHWGHPSGHVLRKPLLPLEVLRTVGEVMPAESARH